MRKGMRFTVGALVASFLLLVTAPACRRAPGVDRAGDGTGPGAGGESAGGGGAPSSDPFGREPALGEDTLGGEDLSGSGAAGMDAAALGLQVVYFEFNRSALTTATLAALDRNAEILRRHAQIRVRIEGHCDDRGTVEYNLALGDRRAAAVRDHLVSRGIERSRLETVSFGEERPVETASHEAAWARNRRAEFHVF